MGAGEEVEDGGGVTGIVDRISEVGDRANEVQTAGVHGTGFIAGSLARVDAGDGMRWLGIKVGSDKELAEVGTIGKR